MPLVSLDHISLAFGHSPLLDDISFQLEPRERVCVIGRNGTGKSTLLRILSGDQAPDSGSVWMEPGLRRGNNTIGGVSSERGDPLVVVAAAGR